MPYVYPAPKSCALDMQSKAMEAPMPDLITEITELSYEALLITMVCIVHAALTVVKVGELHLQAGSSLLEIYVHGHLIECQLF
jgi:hypothetical protein